MLNNIQKYLLIQRPLLWNIRIVPVLICTVLINFLFFGIGYSFRYTDFHSIYSYSSSEWFIYFISVIAGILSFIFWMIHYSQNNAFKVFYPKSTGKIYSEWLLIFVIVFSMVSYPLSLTKGIEQKIKSFASKAEAIEAANVINMIPILIPSNKTNYYLEYPEGYEKELENKIDTAENVATSQKQRSINDRIEEAEETQKIFEEYPDFAQLSLLNYDRRNYDYIPVRYKMNRSSYYDDESQDSRTIKEWLVNENKEKIEKLMDSFLALHKKHHLKTNLTKDQWMKLVYNPRKYPVGDFNLIHSWNIDDTSSSYDQYGEKVKHDSYYLQYSELMRAYSKITDAYIDKESNRETIFFAVCFALSISLMVFSYRVTSGKAWLIALVSGGLIMLVFLFFNLIFYSFSYFFIGVLLCWFAYEFIYVLLKIINKKTDKGFSDIIINHLVWFIPVIPAIILLLIYDISHGTCKHSESFCLYKYIDTHIWKIFWGNIVLAFISMWCFIRFFLLKWKSLPEG